MPVSAVIQPDILERFRRLIKNERLAHAYLFSGPKGMGKFSTALAVAKMLNCEKDSAADCACPACRKVDAGSHPDVFVVEKLEDKTEIGIEQFRDGLLPRLAFRPFEGKKKVVVIKDADGMSVEAANSFLKTLEEPAPDTVLILTTVAPARLLRTIFSRCQEMRFFPLGNSALATRLENEYDVSSLDADILAKFAAGSPGRAFEFKGAWLEHKNAVLDDFVLGHASEATLKKYSAGRDAVRELCDVLLTFYRDIFCLKNGAEDAALIHRDRASDVRRLAEGYSFQDLGKIIEQLVRTRQAADENFNVKIALTLLKEFVG